MSFYDEFNERIKHIKLSNQPKWVLLQEITDLRKRCDQQTDLAPRQKETIAKTLQDLTEKCRDAPPKFTLNKKLGTLINAKQGPLVKSNEAPKVEYTAGTVLISNGNSATYARLRNCVLSIDVMGSVYLDDLENCVVLAKCHQFRLHNSARVTVYVSCKRPIIESSKNIKFGSLENEKQVEAVDDFDWFREEHSPNWGTISESLPLNLNEAQLRELM